MPRGTGDRPGAFREEVAYGSDALSQPGRDGLLRRVVPAADVRAETAGRDDPGGAGEHHPRLSARAVPQMTGLLSGIAGLGLAALLAMAGATTAPAVQGDPAAQAEVLAAFRKLNALPGYRMKVTTADEMALQGEIVPPDREHWTGQGAQLSGEWVRVGTAVRTRFVIGGTPGGWQCNISAPSFLAEVDKHKNDVTALRRPDAVIDGVPVRVYTDGAGSTLYIGTRTGLPRRLVSVNSQSGKGDTLDFFDYGAKLTITLPPCA
ncbi:MAG TPA: hypothetical protein VJT32_11165 [bacterium]|nr:hypothetical protein [bacterium]